MPELPEVETTRRGIAPHLEGQRVSRVVVRERRLRWPIPDDLDVRLSGQKIIKVERRAKYLLINAEVGTLISHLGMSGNLRLVEAGLPAAKHEHVDIELESGLALRAVQELLGHADIKTTHAVIDRHDIRIKLMGQRVESFKR